MSNLRILLEKKIKETDILSLEINEKNTYKGVFIGSTASEIVLLQDNLEPVYLHYEDVTDYEVLGSNGLDLYKKKELVKDNDNKTFLENLTGKGEKLIHAFFKEVKKIDDRFELKEAKESIIFKNAEGKQIPDPDITESMFMRSAILMSQYTGTTKGGVPIDEAWCSNDGLVNEISAKTPSSAVGKPYTPDEALVSGIWYEMPTTVGDHMYFQGGMTKRVKIRPFYLNMVQMICGLK